MFYAEPLDWESTKHLALWRYWCMNINFFVLAIHFRVMLNKLCPGIITKLVKFHWPLTVSPGAHLFLRFSSPLLFSLPHFLLSSPFQSTSSLLSPLLFSLPLIFSSLFFFLSPISGTFNVTPRSSKKIVAADEKSKGILFGTF